MENKLTKGSVLLLLILVCMPQKADAYVDFGTGSMVVQSIMAAAVGIGFFFKDKLLGILSLFSGKKKKKKDAEDE